MPIDDSTREVPDGRVFEWLGTDAEGVPYYLHPLNLCWSAQGADQDLQIYSRVADLLAAVPDYWAKIIRETNWRHSLVGCTCLLASRRKEFFEELCYRFRAGSWVEPQIAVTLGQLHGTASRAFFESALEEPAFRRKPKQAVSAHRVLLHLGVDPKHDIIVDSWTDFELDDAMIANEVVRAHWSFWSGRA